MDPAVPTSTRKGALSPEFSLYLDLVRFLASAFVFVSHSNDRVLSTEVIPLATFGHSAVVVFFVLSGLVIAYVTGAKEKNWRSYTASRMARIYSVALPAVFLTLVLDVIGQRINPVPYEGVAPLDHILVRITASLAFLNEFWWISIQTFSNTPYWSLSYEVWYYVLFGVFVFWRGRGRPWALAVAALLTGPKILLLLPVWLLGVAVYRSAPWTKIGPGSGLALFVGSLVLLVLFHRHDVDVFFFEWLKSQVGEAFHRQMTWSRYFISDYLLGLVVAANFVGFRAAEKVLGKPLKAFARPIRMAAGFTLSMYLFHRPLIYFFTAWFDGDPGRPWFWLSVVGATTISIVVLGLLTEHRKDAWRRFFDRVVGRL
jgi:peptidoglycan/LPS O-acetylase OafA/YrhL